MSPKTFDDGVNVDKVVIYSSAATNNRKSALSTKIITSTTGSLIPVVDHNATIEQERIHRTNDIRERLGPIMERLMSSVTKIQTLEDSLRLGVGSDGDDDDHNHNHDDTSSTSSKSTNYEHTIIRPGETRRIVNKSMELVKKKMLRLKNMEDKLEALEDRRIILRRHCQLQDKAPIRSQAKSTTDEKSDNLLYQDNRIIELEEEVSLMKKKCRLVDDLQARNVQLENDLMYVGEALQEKSQTDLQQQKNDEYMHVKGDSLEHKVECLTASTCDDLKKENKNLPQTIKNQKSQESTVVVTTPISLTETSIIDKLCIVDNDTCNTSSMTDDSFSLFPTPNGMDGTVELQQQHNPRDFSEREDDASSRSSSNSGESLMIENLTSKIKNLDRENALLRESNDHAIHKFKTFQQEIMRQSSVIKGLQLKLDSNVVGGTEQSEEAAMIENKEADKLSLSCRVAMKTIDERGKQSVVKNTGDFLFKRLLFKHHKNGQSEK
jgi:hypothetical protein